MMHLFLWRNLQSNLTPKTYAITTVNMGDRPASAIAQTALRESALEATEEYPEASKIIIQNSYMNDILAGVKYSHTGHQAMEDISNILQRNGFAIKEWNFSGKVQSTQRSKDQKAVQSLLNKSPEEKLGKVLGMGWEAERDTIKFSLTELVEARIETTKRECLSTIYSIYDLMGLLTPITVAAKIILRKVWSARPHIGWDDILPGDIQREWNEFRNDLSEVQNSTFKRCIKPTDGEQPILVIFSDGSEQAYGVVAYVRWKTPSGFVSTLIAAKSRIAPLKIIDTVRLELCGAVLNSRLYTFIKEEMKLTIFTKVYHVVDSEIVKAMINKESYGFNTFAANRIGEIHRNTTKENWYWIEGGLNIADITTRGCRASELNSNSVWQNGPDFLRLPESDWPILQDTNITALPEEKKQHVVSTVTTVNRTSLVSAIDIERFSKLSILLNTTARILKLYARYRKNGNRLDKEILPEDIVQAENIWIKYAQEGMAADTEKGKYKKLNPTINGGILVVAGRTEKWMEATWNNQYFILLPKGHRLSYLIALSSHQSSGHLGVSSTIAVIR